MKTLLLEATFLDSEFHHTTTFVFMYISRLINVIVTAHMDRALHTVHCSRVSVHGCGVFPLCIGYGVGCPQMCERCGFCMYMGKLHVARCVYSEGGGTQGRFHKVFP